MTLSQVEEMIQDLFEGNLSPEQWLTLQDILKQSPEALDIYCSYARMHSVLGERAQELQSIEAKTPIVPFEKIVKTQRRKTLTAVMLSVAALVAISLVTLWFIRTPEPEPALIFKAAPDSRYSITHDSSTEIADDAMILEKGSKLTISQGTIELNFSSGVKSIIQAPAEITVLEEDILFLRKGVAWFEVPENAKGFRVKTPELLITDLGTEFGVISNDTMHDEVHLLKGSIIVESLNALKESETLNTRSARKSSAVGRINTTPLKSDLFITQLPSSLPYMHWSFDGVSDGGFIATGNHSLLDKGFAKPKQTPANDMLSKGRFGNAVRFRGREQDGLFTQWYGISGDRARTIACWVKIDSQIDGENPVSLINWGLNKPGISGINTKYRVSLFNTKLRVSGFNASNSISALLNDNKWHHFAVTYEKSAQGTPSVKIYLDGQLTPSKWNDSTQGLTLSAPSTIIDHDLSDPVIFGVDLFTPGQGHNFPFNGMIDEIYIFEGSLEASSIEKLYKQNIYSP